VSEATWDARYTESTMYLWYRDRDTVYATTIFFLLIKSRCHLRKRWNTVRGRIKRVQRTRRSFSSCLESQSCFYRL